MKFMPDKNKTFEKRSTQACQLKPGDVLHYKPPGVFSHEKDYVVTGIDRLNKSTDTMSVYCREMYSGTTEVFLFPATWGVKHTRIVGEFLGDEPT